MDFDRDRDHNLCWMHSTFSVPSPVLLYLSPGIWSILENGWL